MGNLDTLRRHLYKARPLWLLGLLWCGVAQAEVVLGVQLPDGAQKVGENRYRLTEDYEGALKYFRLMMPGDRFPRKAIINQPGVKAVHIRNPARKLFDGLNIYEANGEVRVFIVAAPPPPPVKATPKKGKKK
jgi:hypothetical protein